LPKSKTPSIWDIDLEKNMGNWIITVSCPFCDKWYSTILSLYHKGSGPAPLVHELKNEKHTLEVLDLKAKSWSDIEILTKRSDNGKTVVLKGNLGGRFYQAESQDSTY
jgi:hypothetical protein